MTYVSLSKPKSKPASVAKKGQKRQSVPIHQKVNAEAGFGDFQIQPKLKIGESNDKYEQEADRVAAQVMRMPESQVQRKFEPIAATNGIQRMTDEEEEMMQTKPVSGTIQRMCTGCEEEKLQRKPLDNKPFISALNPLQAQFVFPQSFPTLQRQEMPEEEDIIQTKPLASTASTGESQGNSIESSSVSGEQTHQAESHFQENFSNLNTGGSPLPQTLRTFYENRFGYDFGQVRIHNDSKAQHLNESLHAYAFTYGNHVWLGANETLKPSFCLTHEFVHVVQQTKPPRLELPSSRQSRPVLTSPTATQTPLVQRILDAQYFWVPNDFNTGEAEATGKEIQKHIYTDATRPSVQEEVSIPNAARKIKAEGSECGLEIERGGQADLYLADGKKRIGVRFKQDGSPGGLNTKYSTRRPLVDKGEIKKIDEGPEWVRIGEIKPASKDQITLGTQQVQNYLEGIKCAVRLTNRWALEKKKSEKWNLNEQELQPMKEDDFKLHPDYKFNKNNPRSDYDLILGSFSQAEKFKIELNPQKDLGQPVKGGLYANYYGKGVWAYFARPANLDALLKLPKLKKELKAPIKVAQTVENEVVHKITGAPIVPMTYRKPGVKAPVDISHTSPPLQIQPKGKKPRKVQDDPFQAPPVKTARKDSFEQLKKGEETKSFKQLRFIDRAYQAEEGLDPKVRNDQLLPDKNELAVPLDSKQNSGSRKKGKGSTQKQTKRPLPTLYSWLKLWTNPAIDLLADFRQRFGTVFVAIYRKIVGIKTEIGNKIQDVFNKNGGNAKGTSYGAVAIRAIGRGLKAIGQILIPQTLRLVTDSLIDGVKEKMLKILPLDIASLQKAVNTEFSEITAIAQKLEELESTIETQFDTILNKFDEQLAEIKQVIKVAEKIGDAVKWTVRAIQCVTPPGWGCLKLVFSSLTAWAAEQVLNDCSLQKIIACKLADLEFIQEELPFAIAQGITDELNSSLGAIDPRLSLFAPIEKNKIESIDCQDIGCEGEPDKTHEAFVRLEESLQAKWGVLGAASIMNSLFEISLKSGFDEDQVLTANELDQLNKLLLEANISPMEFEILAEAFKDKSKVKPATVQEFIDSIKERQQQMFSPTVEEATGGTGEEEGVSAGQKPTTGDKTKTIASGESEGIPTVESSEAEFTGKITNSLSQTQIIVEDPSIKKHTAQNKSPYKVNLIGLIDGQPQSRVTNVSVDVPNRIWGPDKKTIVIRYQLLEGVSFRHNVPNVPTFSLEKNTIIPMPVEISSPQKKQNEPED